MKVFSKSSHVVTISQTLHGWRRGNEESSSITSVDDTCRLRRLRALADRPLPDLVRARREEAVQVQDLPHRRDDLGQRRLGAELLALFVRLGLAERRQALLEGHGQRNDRVARRVRLDPFGDLGQVLVLLPDVVLLAEVDEEDDGLGGQEEQRVNDFDLRAVC